MVAEEWVVHNPGGERRVVVTKQLPGDRWLELLVAAGCSVEVCTSPAVLTIEEISERIGSSCDGVIGQLTEEPSFDEDYLQQGPGGEKHAERFAAV